MKRLPLRNFQITSPYNAITGKHPEGHTGVDFTYSGEGERDDTIYSPVHGYVIEAAYIEDDINTKDKIESAKPSSWGNYVVLKSDHEEHYLIFAHLAKVSKEILGATSDHPKEVEEDQELGIMGNTGNSTGPHLHFEVRHVPKGTKIINIDNLWEPDLTKVNERGKHPHVAVSESKTLNFRTPIVQIKP